MQLPKQCPDLSVQPVGDELLVLDVQAERIHQLNATASWIFSRCDGATTVAMMSAQMSEAFSVDEAIISHDLEMTLAQLQQLRLIDEVRV